MAILDKKPPVQPAEIAGSGFPVSGYGCPHFAAVPTVPGQSLAVWPSQPIPPEDRRAAPAGAGAKPAVGDQISRRSEVFQNHRLEGNDDVPARIASKHAGEIAHRGFVFGDAAKFGRKFLGSPAHDLREGGELPVGDAFSLFPHASGIVAALIGRPKRPARSRKLEVRQGCARVQSGRIAGWQGRAPEAYGRSTRRSI